MKTKLKKSSKRSLKISYIYSLKFFRALSSVGLEHLVYTEGVGGSNPSAPTFLTSTFDLSSFVGVFYFPDFLFSFPLNPVTLSPNSVLAFSPSSSIFDAISGNSSYTLCFSSGSSFKLYNSFFIN